MSVLFFEYLIEAFCDVYLGGLDLHCGCNLPVQPVVTCRSSHSKFIVQSEIICIISSINKPERCALISNVVTNFGLTRGQLCMQGRLLLAAASGRVLARSFHSFQSSIAFLGGEALGQSGSGRISTQTSAAPVIEWKRRELSVILEHVQAHIAPTDVDPRAGLQWLPKIPTGAPKIKRTGTLLERVFMPCTMYFQYTRQKGGTTDCKVVVLLPCLQEISSAFVLLSLLS